MTLNEEQLKDIRLMIELLAKDYIRLSDDLKYLSEYLRPKKEEVELNAMEHR